MIQITEARRQALLAQLEQAGTAAEIAAIEAALSGTSNKCRWALDTLAELIDFFCIPVVAVKGGTPDELLYEVNEVDLESARSLLEQATKGDAKATAYLINKLGRELQRERMEALRIVPTLGDVAELCGVAVSTVREWRMANPPMPGEPGRWNVVQILNWYEQRALRRH